MNHKSISYRCDDGAELFTFTRYDYDQFPESSFEPSFEMSLEDAYCGGAYSGVKNRLVRAWRAFWSKPIYYSSVYTEDGDELRAFLQKCITLIDKSKKVSGWLEAEDGDGAVCPHCGADFCVLVYETDDFIFCPHCGKRVIYNE